jgi:transcription initiation factor TFIIB
MHGCSEIRRLCGALGFGESIQEQASALFRTAQGEDLLLGRSIESMAAASVYAVTRCNGLPRTLAEIGRVAVVGEDRVECAYRTLNTELGLPAKPITPSAYVPRLASDLDVSETVRTRARRLAERAEDRGLANGVQPSGFAAACVYLASDNGQGLTQRAVANAADTTPATVRKHRDTLRAHVA